MELKKGSHVDILNLCSTIHNKQLAQMQALDGLRRDVRTLMSRPRRLSSSSSSFTSDKSTVSSSRPPTQTGGGGGPSGQEKSQDKSGSGSEARSSEQQNGSSDSSDKDANSRGAAKQGTKETCPATSCDEYLDTGEEQSQAKSTSTPKGAHPYIDLVESCATENQAPGLPGLVANDGHNSSVSSDVTIPIPHENETALTDEPFDDGAATSLAELPTQALPNVTDGDRFDRLVEESLNPKFPMQNPGEEIQSATCGLLERILFTEEQAGITNNQQQEEQAKRKIPNEGCDEPQTKNSRVLPPQETIEFSYQNQNLLFPRNFENSI